jgi:hypothetical protein
MSDRLVIAFVLTPLHWSVDCRGAKNDFSHLFAKLLCHSASVPPVPVQAMSCLVAALDVIACCLHHAVAVLQESEQVITSEIAFLS